MPVGESFPKSGGKNGTVGSMPGAVEVMVGKRVGVRMDKVGVTEPGVAVERAVSPGGVEVGRGRGGFRNV